MVLHHALRNALIRVVTVSALQVGPLLAGDLVIELVFARPGRGRLIVDAVQARDYPQRDIVARRGLGLPRYTRSSVALNSPA